MIAVIKYDSDVESPRESFDNLGIMACHHSKYKLGDEDFELKCSYCNSWDEVVAHNFYYHHSDEFDFEIYRRPPGGIGYYYLEEDGVLNERGVKRVLKWVDKNVVLMPVYMYDHSGITVSTEPFSCKWDSGQVGIIYATRRMINAEYGDKALTKALKKKVADVLRGEVEIYDMYIRGDVYCIYTFESDDDLENDCSSDVVCGYYGIEFAREAAKTEFGADDVREDL